MVVETIFNDARRGIKPTDNKVIEVFGTDNTEKIAKAIVDKGSIQITTQQRRRIIESKKRKIVAYISSNAIDPQTHTPHPPLRIQMALEEAKFCVDPFKPLEKEIEEAMRLLRPILPIGLKRSRIEIRLRGNDYRRCYDDIIHYGAIKREKWGSDESWVGLIEIPIDMVMEITEKLKHRTNGDVFIKLVN